MMSLKGRMVKAGFLLVILVLGSLAMYSIRLVDLIHSRELNTTVIAQQNAGLAFLDQSELDNKRDLFFIESLIVETPIPTTPILGLEKPIQQDGNPVVLDKLEPVGIVNAAPQKTEVEPDLEINPVSEYSYVGYLQKGNSLDAFIMLGDSSLVVRDGDWLSPRLFIQSITDENVVINVKPSGKIYKLVINEENI